MASPAAPRLGAGAPELRGILLYLGAILSFSCMDVVAKLLMERHDPIMVVWARYASQAFWATVILAPWLPRLVKTKRPGLHAIRASLPFGATMFGFAAMQQMPLADVMAVFEVAPLIITALAFLILREPVGRRRWTGVGVGFLGALLIIRPGTDVFSLATLLPLAAAFFYASYAIATRYLGSDESPWTAFFYTAIGGAVLATLAVPFGWSTPSWQDAAVMSVFGVIGGAGQILMILALRAAGASTLAPISYLGLVFATFWGFTVFGDFPDGWTIAGAVVITGAGLYVWARERQLARARAREARAQDEV